MGQSLVEPDERGHLVRIAIRQIPNEVLVVRLTGPEKHHLQIVLQVPLGRGGNQVESLLLGHPRNHAEQRRVMPRR